jgi:hypothetical protein
MQLRGWRLQVCRDSRGGCVNDLERLSREGDN